MTEQTDPTADPTATAPTRTADPAPTVEPGPHRPSGAINPKPVQYKGEPLEPARGPGLGCFRFQMVLLVILILATPLSVGRVPDAVTAILLFATIVLLLISGQTMIFLLRLIAADRRGRRQPLAPRSSTVGQIEDDSTAGATSVVPPDDPGPPGEGPVRQ